MEGWMKGVWMDGCGMMEGKKVGWVAGWMDGWMEGRDRRMDGWTDERTSE